MSNNILMNIRSMGRLGAVLLLAVASLIAPQTTRAQAQIDCATAAVHPIYRLQVWAPDFAKSLQTEPFYFKSLTNYFYTKDLAEAKYAVEKLGYRFDGIAFYAFTNQLPGTVAIQRYYNYNNSGLHVYRASNTVQTTDSTNNFNMGTSEGTIGYLATDQAALTAAVAVTNKPNIKGDGGTWGEHGELLYTGAAVQFAPYDFSNTIAQQETKIFGYSCKAGQVVGAPVYRMFNAARGLHFYTTSDKEVGDVSRAKLYTYEGVGFLTTAQASQFGDDPLLRLYNPQYRKHFYTSNAAERENAVAKYGYVYEGSIGFVDLEIQTPWPAEYTNSDRGLVFRSFNPRTFDHLYSSSGAENEAAKQAGYVQEGSIGWVPTYSLY